MLDLNQLELATRKRIEGMRDPERSQRLPLSGAVDDSVQVQRGAADPLSARELLLRTRVRQRRKSQRSAREPKARVPNAPRRLRRPGGRSTGGLQPNRARADVVLPELVPTRLRRTGVEVDLGLDRASYKPHRHGPERSEQVPRRQGSAVGWLAGKECSPRPGTRPRSAATTADPCLPGYSPLRRVKGPLRGSPNHPSNRHMDIRPPATSRIGRFHPHFLIGQRGDGYNSGGTDGKSNRAVPRRRRLRLSAVRNASPQR